MEIITIQRGKKCLIPDAFDDSLGEGKNLLGRNLRSHPLKEMAFEGVSSNK
jgi:hypothetical protein